MSTPCKREKLFHGKLSLTPTHQSLFFTVFNFSLKAGANPLNGPLTKQGDGNDCFLILHKGRGKKDVFWSAAWAGWDSSDPCTDWVNVGLGVTTDQQGQRLGTGAQEEDHRYLMLLM